MFSSYISSLLSVGICAFICESLISNKNLSRTMNLLTSLCLFTVVISPILSFIVKGDIKNIFDTAKYNTAAPDSEISFCSLIEEETQKQIEKEIYQNYGIQVPDTIIELNIDQDEMTVNSAVIYLKKQDISQAESIKEYLAAIFGNDTKITVTEKQE